VAEKAVTGPLSEAYLRALRISESIKAGNPLLTEECLICHRSFVVGQRTIFAPPVESNGANEVPEVPIHVYCALRGASTPVGQIAQILDGDDPLIVLMTDGKKYTLTEAGLMA
jgi:hypothetical protein